MLLRLIEKPPLYSKAGNDTRARRLHQTRRWRTEKTFIPRRQTLPLQVVEEKSFDIAPSNSVKPGYGGIHFIMSKIKVTLSGFMFLLVLLFGLSRVDSRNPDTKNTHNGDAPSGTLQKMIVENASVTMQLDLNGLNGSNSLVARPVTLQFSVAANSFFPILVFNDLLRAVKPGSMALIPSRSGGIPALPARLGASVKQLVVEKLPSNQSFGLAVRDSKTGFTFFNVEGGDYDYNANARSFGIDRWPTPYFERVC